MNNHPKVSVILPVYNGEKYLREAVKSILNQSFADFEFIIINDGSKEGSKEILESYKDTRIKIVHQENKGLAGALNVGIGLAQGEYIARQDQDDIALPERLKKQVEFLDAHPDHGMVGTWAAVRRSDKDLGREFLKPPADDASLKYDLIFENHFVHSSVMVRKSVFESVGVYSVDPKRQPPEDYELWSRIIRKYKVANIPEALQIYRIVQTSMTQSGVVPLKNVATISAENLSFILGLSVPNDNVWNFVMLYFSFWKGKPELKISLIKAIAILWKLSWRISQIPFKARLGMGLNNIKILFRLLMHHFNYLAKSLKENQS